MRFLTPDFSSSSPETTGNSDKYGLAFGNNRAGSLCFANNSHAFHPISKKASPGLSAFGLVESTLKIDLPDTRFGPLVYSSHTLVAIAQVHAGPAHRIRQISEGSKPWSPVVGVASVGRLRRRRPTTKFITAVLYLMEAPRIMCALIGASYILSDPKEQFSARAAWGNRYCFAAEARPLPPPRGISLMLQPYSPYPQIIRLLDGLSWSTSCEHRIQFRVPCVYERHFSGFLVILELRIVEEHDQNDRSCVATISSPSSPS
ncbi:hypothetical protein CC78DRAFT_582554 [Lojkania enalia]|uniref:Uncharacterized protein n=1 Tax=Lojkania enalia TaxID=147567 RepID=A0A9P4MYF0_9PLEO|nr:hypothetical protein CC78DRAFT_582554 [Didymosphaeria enalia]